MGIIRALGPRARQAAQRVPPHKGSTATSGGGEGGAAHLFGAGCLTELKTGQGEFMTSFKHLDPTRQRFSLPNYTS